MTVTIVRTAGKEPITGKFFNQDQETVNVNTSSKQGAYFAAIRSLKMTIMGMDVQAFIDGQRFYPNL